MSSTKRVTFSTNISTITYGTDITIGSTTYSGYADSVARMSDPGIKANLRNRRQISDRLSTTLDLLTSPPISSLSRTSSQTYSGGKRAFPVFRSSSY